MKEVMIYGQKGCGACIFTRKYLEKHGVDNIIEKDINESKQARLDIDQINQKRLDRGRPAFTSTPIVLIEGEEPFEGFDLQSLQLAVEDQ